MTTSTPNLTIAPWVSRRGVVPEAISIAQKLMILSTETEDISAPEWNTPTTREEVKELYQQLDSVRMEFNRLWEQVLAS